MTVTEQASIAGAPAWPDDVDERSARASLRAQIARLERELSTVVAAAFPHVRPLSEHSPATRRRPHMPSLGDLERARDELAGRVRAAQSQAQARRELAERSRALLEEMKRVPARHKLVRLKVADLGEGGCGVWEVRPRLGLIGMLAGWWQVKLSSGCP